MHRLRSILTALGIIFGVSSVIAMLAIGEGASQEAQEQIARLGSRNIIVKTVRPVEETGGGDEGETMTAYGLTYNDAELFRNTIPNVEVVVPSCRMNQKAWYRNREVNTEIIGTVPWYSDISPTKVLRGRFLTSMDVHYQQKVCVVDEEVVKELFVIDDPMGRDIKIKNAYYQVIGVVSTVGPIGVDSDLLGGALSAQNNRGGGLVGSIYIPLTAFKSSFGEMTFTFSAGSRTAEKVELEEITVKVQTTEQVIPTRDILDKLLTRIHKKNDYQIIVPLELLRQAARTKRIFTIVLGSIAAISLVVGGIGIMNIMLATVSERTREIGIRRALGARRRDIIIQFLSETVMLTLLGGIFGIILGIFIPYLVTQFGKMPTVITPSSLFLAFGISGAVGITFGIYPAYRAANMDPVESLRHE